MFHGYLMVLGVTPDAFSIWWPYARRELLFNKSMLLPVLTATDDPFGGCAAIIGLRT